LNKSIIIIINLLLLNNAFRKEWLCKFGFKIDKILKKSFPENERSTNVVFKLKGRIPLLFYSVKHIHGQFKTYLKLKTGVFVFKQIAKSIPTVQWEKPCRDILLNPFCFVSYRFLNLYDTIYFDMSCFHCSVWRSDRCIVFSKLVKWKVLLKLYFERYSFTFHFTKFLSHFLKNYC
jgi:hypothetical protein